MMIEKKEEFNRIIEKLKTKKLTKIDKIPSFLGIETYEAKLNNGKTIKREKIIKTKKDGNAVIIVALTKDNEVILTIEPRVFTEETVTVGFPSGYIEENENEYNAALRELKEEVGYIPEKLIHLKKYYQDEGCSGALNHAFLALNCEKKDKQHLDKDEYIEYILCKEEELEYLIENEYILGANALLTYHEVKKYRKEKKNEKVWIYKSK